MKLFIPSIGTQFLLTEDWEFSLVKDERNKDIFKLLNIPWFNIRKIKYQALKGQVFGKVTIPKWSILQVDRIYIRQQNEEDSLSFHLKKTLVNENENKNKNIPVLQDCRFFAKLEEVNKINYEVYHD
jgi:hypothetical protein